MGPQIFQFIGASIDGALNAYVTLAANTVSSAVVGVVVTLMTIYYLSLGMAIATGYVTQPIGKLGWSLAKFTVITALALSAPTYLAFVVDTLKALETGLAASFSGANGVAPGSVYQVIDDSLGKGWAVAADLWERAGNREWDLSMAVGEYLESIVIAVSTGIIGFPAGAMIVTAKALLSLMLGVGPLFVLSLMWPVTRQFFDKWFSVVIMAILQIALLAAVLAFAINMFLVVVASIDIDSTTDSVFFSALRLAGFAVVALWLLYRVYDVSAQLAGGMSTGALTLGRMAASSMRAISAPGRGLRHLHNAVNPESTRLDPRTGFQTRSRRLEHLATGRSLVARNPAYRQAVLARVRDSWIGLNKLKKSG